MRMIKWGPNDGEAGNADWNNLYSESTGTYYVGIVNLFKTLGITEENIKFINYFTDSTLTAKEKINKANILYFLGLTR
jgi:hypothetical protein